MKTNTSNYLKERFNSSINLINSLDEKFYNKVEKIFELSLKCINNNGKIITFGNGGSASDAIHLSGELVGRFKFERNPINSICLNTNISVITSIANDYSYDDIFIRQLEAITNKNDVILAISTSGSSKNIIKCLDFVRNNNINFFMFTGEKTYFDEEYIKTINVPSNSVDKIQEIFFFFMHSYCEFIELNVFKNTNKIDNTND